MVEPKLPGRLSGERAVAAIDDAPALPPTPSAASVPAIDLSTELGLPSRVQRRNWSLSLLSAGAAHVLVLLAVVPQSSEQGAGLGTELEGIDVDVVSVVALDRLAPAKRSVGTGAEAPIYGAVGVGASAAVAALAADQPDQKRAPEPETARQQPALVVNEEVVKPPQPDDIVVAPKREVEPPSDDRSELAKAEPKTEPADTRSAPSQAAEHENAGGAAMPGEAASATTASMGGGASSETIARYRRSIVEALAARKPHGRAGVRGTVRIAFTISPTGEIGTVRVSDSSRRSELDEEALSAVKNARFPIPPPGLPANELHYEIPYYFR
jgi:protein TonB